MTGPVEVQVEESVSNSKKRREKKKKADAVEEEAGRDLLELIKPRILMVRTENVVHEPFKNTQEVKVQLLSVMIGCVLMSVLASVTDLYFAPSPLAGSLS